MSSIRYIYIYNMCMCNYIFLDAISSFIFKYPSYMIKPKCLNNIISHDNDNDIVLDRQQEGKLLIGIN